MTARVQGHFRHLAPWLRLMMTLRMISPAARQETRILDVGCGDGTLMRNLGGQSIGIDVSSDLLKSARANSGAEVVVASASALPFRPDTFDIVVCTEVLEHLDDMEAAVSQMSSVMKLNGTAHFTIPLASWYRLILFRILRKKPYYLSEAEHKREFSAVHVRRFTPLSELFSLVARFGLRIQDISGAYFLPDKMEGPIDLISGNSPRMKALLKRIDALAQKLPKLKFFGRYLGISCIKIRRPQSSSL